MHKKGVTQVVLVSIISTVIALVVLFSILLIVKNASVKFGGEKTCQWNLLVSSFVKNPISGSSLFPPECKSRFTTVSLKDIKSSLKRSFADRRFAIFRLESDKYAGVLKRFKSSDGPSEEDTDEFVLYSILGDELASCWNKVWQGQIPLFDQWWNLVDWGANTKPVSGADASEKLKKYVAEGKSISILGIPLAQFYGPPAFCVVCSQVKFSSDLKEHFSNKKDFSALQEWLSINPYPKAFFGDGSPMSYYEFLLSGQSVSSSLFLPKYEFNIDETYAVVYKRINVHGLSVFVSELTNLFGDVGNVESYESISSLELIPYSKVRKPYNIEGGVGDIEAGNCAFVVD